jgi:hypothetical protein
MTTVRDASPAPTAAPTSATRPGPARVVPETELTLLLDVGTAWTKAALVGRAGGRWRIVSGTAQPTSWGESVLVEDLVDRLAPHADNRLARRLAILVREAPRITCRSPRRAGRMALVAASARDLEAARIVAVRSGWIVDAAVSTADGRTDAERFDLLRRVEADAWLVVPGHTSSTASLWGLTAGARGRGSAPVLVAGGAEEEIQAYAQLFGGGARRVSGGVDDALAQALLVQLTATHGLDDPRLATPIAFGRSLDALARGLGLSVLGVDLGAMWLGWRQGPDPGAGRAAMLAGNFESTLPAGSRAAAEILPADVDQFTTTDAMAGLAARRAGIPATPIEAAIAQAIGIDRLAAARHWLGGTPSVDLVVGAGRLLAAAPHPADAAMVLLDGLRPPGVTQLALDPWGICGPLGALAEADVDEGLETLRDDLLVPLGTSVLAHGGKPGQTAFRARLHRAGWPDSLPVEVRGGSMTVLPLERGAHGELEIELERGVHVGTSVRGPRLRAAVTGGSVGVILDARDDPIQLPARPGDARSVIQTWRDTLRREGHGITG